MSPGGFSVRNPVLINILMATILITGGLTLSRMPREQFPEVPFFWVNILIPAPGLSSEDVEKTITSPVEEEMRGIGELKELVSISSEGLSIVQVQFNDGISNDIFLSLFQEVRTRFNRVDLPDGALKETIDDFSSSDFLPVIEVILSGTVEYDLLNRHSIRLAALMERIPDVNEVTVIGSLEREITVVLDGRRLGARRIGMDDVVSAISQQSTTIPGGTMNSRYSDYILRTDGEITEPDDLERLILTGGAGDGSGMVRLGEIASIVDGYEPVEAVSRFNGEPAITLRVAKIPGGDSVRIVERVRETARAYSRSLPQGVALSLFNDSTVQIQSSITVLVNNALWGLLLLEAILFLFIGLRNALITGLGIPVSFGITFIVLDLMGVTLNGDTLFGLVLVLGLIVDHAIVIIENSFRNQQEGLSRREAAILGSDQVVVPVVAATATTVAAFLPLMLLPGTIGKFLKVIPLTVSIALVASTLEGILFIPSHYADWWGKGKPTGDKVMSHIRSWYTRIFDRLYRRRGRVVGLIAVFMVAAFSLVGMLKQELFATEDYTYFNIYLKYPPGTPLSRTQEGVEEFESRILPLIGNGEVVSVLSSIGSSSGQTGVTEEACVAQLTVDLSEREEGRNRSIDVIIEDIRESCSNISGLDSVEYTKAVNGPPTSPPISFRLFGDNYQLLGNISRRIKDRLSNYPELQNIRDNLEGGTPELIIRGEPNGMARYGVSVSQLGRAVRQTFEGVRVATLFWDNESIDLVVRFDPDSIDSIYDLEGLTLATPAGGRVPFSSVATIEPGRGAARIKRVDGRREVTIESDALDRGRIREINADIEALFEESFAPLYPEIELVVGGEFSEFDDLLFQILRIFLFGVFLIYMILGTQFRSYFQPVIILTTLPLAFTGVILFLFVSGTSFSAVVLYAAVALAGIAVNDSIVLLSFINEVRKEESVEIAVKRAVSTRFRPIVLTSITTICGLLPTALGIGGRSLIWGPMASTIIFGLIFSTITALCFIPLVFGLVYDRSRMKRNLRGETEGR